MKLIPLNHGFSAMVDDEDFEELSKYNWYSEKAPRTHYATRYFYNHDKDRKDHIRMHRHIMKVNDPKIQIDHIDRNGLNNQKSNLRPCSCSENHRNCRMRKSTTGFRGVSLYKAKRVWKDYDGPVYRARINHQGKEISIGFYKTPQEAAEARDKKSLELHKEFGVLNFPTK